MIFLCDTTLLHILYKIYTRQISYHNKVNKTFEDTNRKIWGKHLD